MVFVSDEQPVPTAAGQGLGAAGDRMEFMTVPDLLEVEGLGAGPPRAGRPTTIPVPGGAAK